MTQEEYLRSIAPLSDEEIQAILTETLHGRLPDATVKRMMNTLPEVVRMRAQIAALTAKLETVKNLLNGLGHAGYCTAEIATHAPNWQGKLPACDCGLDEILREVGHE